MNLAIPHLVNIADINVTEASDMNTWQKSVNSRFLRSILNVVYQCLLKLNLKYKLKACIY